MARKGVVWDNLVDAGRGNTVWAEALIDSSSFKKEDENSSIRSWSVLIFATISKVVGCSSYFAHFLKGRSYHLQVSVKNIEV